MSIFAFPFLHARFGTLYLMRFFVTLWPVIFILIPVTSISARFGHSDGAHKLVPSTSGTVWPSVVSILSLNKIACMSFAAYSIVIKSAAPTSESLGRIFGLSQTAKCFARVCGPAFVSSLFALSIDSQFLSGNFVWAVMLFVSLCCLILTRRLGERPN